MKRIAIIGTVGLPAKYGGFETLVENIVGENASAGIEYTIFCSGKTYKERPSEYKGAKLKYIGLKANGAQSTLYDILSMMKTGNEYEVALVLGVSGCIFLPVFRWWFKNKLIVNIDGLEHRREKWGKFAKWFLRKSEAMAVKCADVIVADNKGIQNYVTETYGKSSVLIAYGGDHVNRSVSQEKTMVVLKEYGVEPYDYAISVCRIEPENNCHMILEAFAVSGKRLVYIGNWSRSDFGRWLKKRYAKYANIIIHEPEYDLDTLYVLRSNAKLYIHGHSAGGTNPSLVEAMCIGRPIVAYNVVYNRATTEDKASYFESSDELIKLLEQNPSNGEEMKRIAKEKYTWKKIASQYEALY
jgi:glycosyltransferase involved in cell wall biosynthesis